MLTKSVFFTMDDIQDVGSVDFESYHESYAGGLDITTSNDIIDELIILVYQRYFEYYILKKEVDLFERNPSITGDEITLVCRRIDNVINMTYERYYPMLKAYRDNSTDPIPQINSSTTGSTRFNDTPQDGGDYSDDEHTTNITQSVAETNVDSGSLVERLNGLYENWRDVMRDWTSEFKGLFMEVF